MPTTTFTSTHTARNAFGALKVARHPGISIPEEYVEMTGGLYVLGLGGYSADVLEGIRTTVDGDAKIRTFLGKMKEGCPIIAVKWVGKAQSCPPETDRDRLKTLCARLIQSDIGRPLIPRTPDTVCAHATVGELQANLRLLGIFAISDDRGFLRETLRIAPGLLVTANAIEGVIRVLNAKEVMCSEHLP